MQVPDILQTHDFPAVDILRDQAILAHARRGTYAFTSKNVIV